MKWEEVKLGEVITLKRGFDLPSHSRIAGDVPIISSSGFSGLHNEVKREGPGVVTGRYGTLGEVFYINEGYWPLNTSLFVDDFKGNNPRFIFYFLRLLDLAQYNGAAAVPGLDRNVLHNIHCLFPKNLPTQQKIASILSSYDDLIENNQKRIRLLEEAAQNIYREWFVHFRFPGHEKAKFQPNGLPEGWERRKFSSVVQINPKTHAEKGVLAPFISMGSLSKVSMVINGTEIRPISGGAKFINGDTLFARITPCLENGKTGFVQELKDSETVASGSTEFIVFRETTFANRYFIYLTSREFEFRENAIKSMSGSDGRQRVKNEAFDKFILPIPQKKVMDNFRKLMVPIFEKIGVLNNQNQKLKEARDILLPRLMNGTIEV